MHLLICIIVVSAFTFLVIVGVLKVIADLLAMDSHRPPSLSDKYFQEELETEELETEDSDRQRPPSYPVRLQPRRVGGATDLGTAR
jgi:hypothetical protein